MITCATCGNHFVRGSSGSLAQQQNFKKTGPNTNITIIDQTKLLIKYIIIMTYKRPIITFAALTMASHLTIFLLFHIGYDNCSLNRSGRSSGHCRIELTEYQLPLEPSYPQVWFLDTQLNSVTSISSENY